MEALHSISAETVAFGDNTTVAVRVETGHGHIGEATLPAGISLGAGEATLVSAATAAETINTVVAPALIDKDCLEQREIDLLLMNLDGTPNRAKLGANSLLPVSLAVARAAASTLNRELYEHISELAQTTPSMPELVSVVIEGGKHSISEMLVAQELSLIGQAERVEPLLIALEQAFTELGVTYAPGCEGGLAPHAMDDLVIEAVRRVLATPAWQDTRFAIDLAATHAQPGTLLNRYRAVLPIALVEDPCPDDDQPAWADFTAAYGSSLVVAADDLALGDPAKIKDAVRAKLANCLVIKLNQTATLSELLDLVALIQMDNWQHMMSHRGNEVPDDFIVDLAVGTGAHYLKIGTRRSEVRQPKFARYSTIAAQLANSSWEALQA
jgi:enolase